MPPYVPPNIPNLAQESTLQQVLVGLGGSATAPGSFGTWTTQVGGPANSFVLKNTSTTLAELHATNEGVATRWLMLFDAAAVPANGTAWILKPYLIPAAGFLAIFQMGLVTVNGLVAAFSTSNSTFTLAADNALSVTARVT